MRNTHTESHYTSQRNTIPWIDKLIQSPIADYIKNAVFLILALYLVKIKKLSYEDALDIINSWLSKCGK
jgi:hypothetical protein